MHFYLQIYWNFHLFLLAIYDDDFIVMMVMMMTRAIVLCSGPGADGPGRDHVAADAQKVLMLLLLTEWLF